MTLRQAQGHPEQSRGVSSPKGQDAPGPIEGRLWTILRGRDGVAPWEVVINEAAARRLGLRPGASVTIRASCSGRDEALPPRTFHVAGIASFPFDNPDALTAGTSIAGLAEACGGVGADAADFLLVASRGEASATAADITALRPDLRATPTSR